MRRGKSLSKLERNLIERDRRMQMKCLLSRLASCIQTHPSAERRQLSSLLDEATDHINQLKDNIAKLKGKMEQFKILPVVEVKEMGSCVKVNMTSGLNKNFMLYQVLNVLQEEGAEIVSTSYSIVGDRIFYTVSSQPFSSRIGIETSRVHERLMQLVL